MGLKGDKRIIGLILSGQPVPFKEANIFITQPLIKDIVNFGEDDFLVGVNLLINTDKVIEKIREGNFELRNYSDFQLLMIVMSEDESVKSMISDLFTLIFPNYSIRISEVGIDFLTENEDGELTFVGQIHNYNFEIFQNLLSDLFTQQKTKEEELLDYNPANDAAARIAEKLKAGRQKVQEMNPVGSIFANYTSSLSIGLGIDLRVFFEYTPFQLFDSYRRFSDKRMHDFYTRISTMPFMDASKMDTPEEWTRNLYK